jgi:exodeoxyribonuclease V alpha subunit
VISEKYYHHLSISGLLSKLDLHFARLMIRLSGQNLPELFLASALVSRATSDGHVCLELSSVEGKPLITHDTSPDALYCPGLREWREKLDTCSVIGRPGEYKPLILDDHSRIYLYRYWLYEKTLADQIKGRVAGENEGVDVQVLKDGLSRLFGKTQDPEETDWQQVAAFISVVKGLSVISGGPGTGKSSLVAKILALIQEQRKTDRVRMALATPTGKAAVRLQEAVKNGVGTLPVAEGIKQAIVAGASTIHRLLGTIPGSPYFRHNTENPLPVDVVVVDEVSMVDLALMSKLAQSVPSHARLILLGDKDQLASVEAGAVLGEICDTGRFHGFSEGLCERYQALTGDRIDIRAEGGKGPKLQDCVVQLKKSYRFGSDSGIGAVSRAINRGDGNLALNLMRGQYHDIRWKSLPAPNVLSRELRTLVLRGYKPYLQTADPSEMFYFFEQFRVLCAIRSGPYGVSALNHLIEQILREEKLINTEKRWYRGRPILITKNDYNLGLFNGDIGIILPDALSDNGVRACFPSRDGAYRRFPPIRLPEHETVYAMTVHKSQGSEFDNALLVLPDQHSPVLSRELIYTGITRAKQGVEVWAVEGVFLEGVSHRTLRASGLRDALWGSS